MFDTPIERLDPLSEDEMVELSGECVDLSVNDEDVDSQSVLNYDPVDVKGVHWRQRKLFETVGKTFTETISENVTCIWKITAIVRSRETQILYYKYYDKTRPLPKRSDDFEYTECTILKNAEWADFADGKVVARAMRANKRTGVPTTYASMIKHPERPGYEKALHSECKSYWKNEAVGLMPLDFDWTTVDPSQMGDLMLLFTKKLHPDGSLDKYKCRIVFRGDRWKNIHHYETKSSSMEEDALNLLLATAATEDLDISSFDVRTAFLHNRFPDGMTQYVRSPYGLPENLLPKKFKLLRCTYGHPLANIQWDSHSTKTLIEIGFKPLISSPSAFILQKDGEKLILGKVTDDFVIVCNFNSKLKRYALSEIEKRYEVTTRDPLDSFCGLHLERDRKKRIITVRQPGYLDAMETKYPLSLGEYFPSTPYLSTTLSKQDQVLQLQTLSSDRIHDLQMLNGEISWVAHKTRPDSKFALNVCSRYGANPTEYDYKCSKRIALYLIGTKTLGLILGGKYGMKLTATVDTSYATHKDMKSHSNWTTHLGGGGACTSRTKKQTITTDSSTLSELVGGHMALRDILWSRKFLAEIGYPQRSATTLFFDNQSTLKIIENACDGGKTKHIDIRYNILREVRALGEIKYLYLPTEHMISDIGTKVLAKGPFTRLRGYLLGYDTLDEFISDLK